MRTILLFISALTFHTRKRVVLYYVDMEILIVFSRKQRKAVSKHHLDLTLVDEQCVGFVVKHAEKRILEERSLLN